MPLDLTQRVLVPEAMDDPTLGRESHLAALRGLERINRVSRSTPIVWKPIFDLAKQTVNGSTLRVLDIATGAGDVPIALSQWARHRGVRLAIDGCDLSPRAVEHARRRAGNDTSVRFFTRDALNDPIPEDYDVVMCSLFLHHLTDQQAVALLSRMAGAARRLVLVNDLVRSTSSYFGVSLAARTLSLSRVVHDDGPQSVRAAYTMEEVSALARAAGMPSAIVEKRFPCRFLLTWTRPEPLLTQPPALR